MFWRCNHSDLVDRLLFFYFKRYHYNKSSDFLAELQLPAGEMNYLLHSIVMCSSPEIDFFTTVFIYIDLIFIIYINK